MFKRSTGGRHSQNGIGNKLVVHFDEAEGQEIELGDSDYPELLRQSETRRKHSVFAEGYRQTRKSLRSLAAEKQHSKSFRQHTGVDPMLLALQGVNQRLMKIAK